MTPAGYMAKHIAPCPDGMAPPFVSHIYSLSSCVSDDFTEYVTLWRHNGYWLFNHPDDIIAAAEVAGVSLNETSLFFYEVHELEFDEEQSVWMPFWPEHSFLTAVQRPASSSLLGFDIVNFWARSGPECSPLSCNSLAREIPVNEFCLISTFEQAVSDLEQGRFAQAEPGPYRVFAVYAVPWP